MLLKRDVILYGLMGLILLSGIVVWNQRVWKSRAEQSPSPSSTLLRSAKSGEVGEELSLLEKEWAALVAQAEENRQMARSLRDGWEQLKHRYALVLEASQVLLANPEEVSWENDDSGEAHAIREDLSSRVKSSEGKGCRIAVVSAGPRNRWGADTFYYGLLPSSMELLLLARTDNGSTDALAELGWPALVSFGSVVRVHEVSPLSLWMAAERGLGRHELDVVLLLAAPDEVAPLWAAHRPLLNALHRDALKYLIVEDLTADSADDEEGGPDLGSSVPSGSQLTRIQRRLEAKIDFDGLTAMILPTAASYTRLCRRMPSASGLRSELDRLFFRDYTAELYVRRQIAKVCPGMKIEDIPPNVSEEKADATLPVQNSAESSPSTPDVDIEDEKVDTAEELNSPEALKEGQNFIQNTDSDSQPSHR